MTATSDRPVIGVIAGARWHPKLCADAIERSGGEPWVILPDHGLPAHETVARIGGLVVCGQDDQGQDTELRLLEAALEADLPLLCIGWGVYALNTALGGKPPGDISGHNIVQRDGEEASSHHHIYISPGSKLAAVVGSGGTARVNSRHRQGIREAQKSPLLLASAYSLEDGVIEAVESPDHRWVIGVQFHPERRKEMPPHFDRLFQSLVDRAKERMNTTKTA